MEVDTEAWKENENKIPEWQALPVHPGKQAQLSGDWQIPRSEWHPCVHIAGIKNIYYYSRTPVTRTLKGMSEKQFKLAGIRVIRSIGYSISQVNNR